MTPMDYQLMVNNYKAMASLLKKDMVIVVEDLEDRDYWEIIFANCGNTKSIYTVTCTKNNTNQKETGKTHVLKFKNYVDPKFLLCLDSDYDILMPTNPYSIQNYIFQTYTYSIENHQCHHSSLNNLVSIATDLPFDEFDLGDFLLQYSRIIYPLAVLHFMYKIKSIQEYNQDNFHQDIFIDFSSVEVLMSGKILSNLYEKIEDCISKKSLVVNSIDYEITKQKLMTKNICPDNCYLYIQGHFLKDKIVFPLLKLFTNKIMTTKFKSATNSQEKKLIGEYQDKNKLKDLWFQNFSLTYEESQFVKKDVDFFLTND